MSVRPESTADELTAVTRLAGLLTELDGLLKAPYSLTAFENRSVNWGIVVTYRQTWMPEQYQVGDLVSTIPMAPRETRRYTTKQVATKSRTTKEVEGDLRASRSGINETARADREIIDRAGKKTNFKVTADGSVGTYAKRSTRRPRPAATTRRSRRRPRASCRRSRSACASGTRPRTTPTGRD
jgi:hypothetical protein